MREREPNIEPNIYKPEGNKNKDNLEQAENKKETTENRNDLYKHAKIMIDNFCEQYSDPKERIDSIMEKIETFFKHIDKKVFSEEKIEEVKNKLNDCKDISEDEFTDKAMDALVPILDIKKSNPGKFEEAQAHAFNEASDFIEINRLLSYGKSGSIMHIHAPPGETVENKTTLYLRGMKDLAQIVKNDPEIKEITATSFLVSDHQRLFERAGFKVEELLEEMRERHFSKEKKDVKKASIGREEFLEKWLKE